MRLRSLHIARLPGIRPGFTLDDFAPGVNVVLGPNASGKSSLVRALRAALYRDESRHEGVHVEATFDDEEAGGTLAALRVGDDLHWQRNGSPAEGPPLPERRFLSCYTLGVEDLLDDAHATDTDIAAHLARELAGGYDLLAIRESASFRLKSNHGRRESEELAKADQELRRCMQAQQQLQRDEARLETLWAQKAEAETAGRKADLHERALDLLGKRRQRRSLEQQMQEFPDGMDRLRGDEPDTLAELRGRLQQQETDRRDAADQRASAEAELRDSGLTDSELDEGALGDRRPANNELRQAETRLEHKRSELAQAQATLRDAVKALGGAPEQPVRLDPAVVGKVEQALAEKRELDAALRYLEHERNHLPSGDAPDPDPDRLRTARGELFRWLAAPRAPAWTKTRIAAVVAVLGAGIAGITVAGVLVHRGLAGSLVQWSPLGLLLPLAWGGYVLIRRSGAGDMRRREAEARFSEAGLTAPKDWDPAQVEERLATLDRSVVEAEHEDRGIERRRALVRERDAKREALAEVDERLRRIATRVGHDPTLLDTNLQRWLKLAADWDQARRNTEAVRAEHARLASQTQRLRQELVAFLTQHGEAPEIEQAGADTLAERLEHLAARLRQREQARQDIDQADRAMRRLDQEIESNRTKIRALFERLGLAADDDDALRQRMERLADWQELSRELNSTRGLEADRQEQLREREDLLAQVDDGDEEALRSRHDSLREQASSLEELIQTITRIESDLQRAGHERALESARARYQQARERLGDRLNEALYAEAGRFLIEGVEAEHEQAVQPAALRQAREWFKRFTHYQYELIFASGGDPRFAARETTSGEHRRLSELSSGTRMQLLLAVRIAFALSAERGTTRLPLILDEALTTSDPERFRAVAESLAVLARDDRRQVFYLTAQPDDARYWIAYDPDAHCIDLAARRGWQHAIDVPEALTPAERPTVPAPDGQTAEEYAVTIGVPTIDPWTEAEGIHVFFVLRDDLELLHRLLGLGVNRVGRLETLLDSDAADTVLSDEQHEWLRARVEGAKAWVQAWRHGRGQPVDRAALEASGAVTPKQIDRVAALNTRLHGNGQALIDGLADGEVPYFRGNKLEELRTWLQDNGYISAAAPLSELQVELRVASTMRPRVAAATDVTADARALVQSLEGGLQT